MQKVSIKTCAVVTAIALSFSAAAWAQPLSPGKPAGVRAAQLGDKELLVFGGVVVVSGRGSDRQQWKRQPSVGRGTAHNRRGSLPQPDPRDSSLAFFGLSG